MIHGLAVSESGMITKQKQFEVIANNLANATTTGFKRDLAFAELSLAKTNGETIRRCWIWLRISARARFVKPEENSTLH